MIRVARFATVCLLAAGCAHVEAAAYPEEVPADGTADSGSQPAEAAPETDDHTHGSAQSHASRLFRFVLKIGPRADGDRLAYKEFVWDDRTSVETAPAVPLPCGQAVFEAFRRAAARYLKVGTLNSCTVRPDFMQCGTDFISTTDARGTIAQGRHFVAVRYEHSDEVVVVEDDLYELAADGARIPDQDAALGGLEWKIEKVRNAVHEAAHCWP